MEWFSMLAAAVLFAAACNFDTVLLAMGWAVRGVRPSFFHTLVIAGLTTLITWLSLVLGRGAAGTLGRSFAGALGGLVLAGIGLWFVLDWLRSLGGQPAQEAPQTGNNLLGWVALAAALAVNNAGVGVAAGASGVGPGVAAGANFVLTLAALPLGRVLGDRVAGQLLGTYALPLSGLILVALGVWQVMGR